MNAPRQDQHAGEIARNGIRRVHPGLERPARTLERKTFRLRFAAAGFDPGRPCHGVDAAAAKNPAEAGRDIEIGLAPGMDDDGKLAPVLPVENVARCLRRQSIPSSLARRRRPGRARHKRSWRRAANRCRRPAAAAMSAQSRQRQSSAPRRRWRCVRSTRPCWPLPSAKPFAQIHYGDIPSGRSTAQADAGSSALHFQAAGRPKPRDCRSAASCQAVPRPGSASARP